MPEHPCADGLSPACFKAYPAWARQAFAYKLLHIMLPKQLTKRLPRGLNLAMVPPGVEIPPGVIVPPGTIVPPGVVIPPGWTLGDPAPPGVQLPPTVSLVPPGSGITPPLYVQPWAPGPVHVPTPSPVKGPAYKTRNPAGDYSVTWIPVGSTHNFDTVDDYPDVDDSTYNSNSTDFAIDEFDMTPFDIPSGATINNVRVYIRGAADPGEASQMKAFIVFGDVQYFADPQEWFSSGWVEKVFSWALSPYSGNPWTWGEINQIQRFGYKSEPTMDFGDFISRAYLRIDYTV